MPGGESTTISKLIYRYSLESALRDFSVKNNIFGTCAGSILMSCNSDDSRVENFGFLDVSSHRNAWGSQIDSFSDYIDLIDDNLFSKKYYATFIRGPKFFNINKEACTVLGSYGGEPVLIRNKNHLIASFHPEINKDLCIYKYFLNMINE